MNLIEWLRLNIPDWLLLVTWAGCCIWFAHGDDKKIEYRDKWGKWKSKIKHFWNGLRHIVAAGLIWWITQDIKMFFATLCAARFFFSISLNLFRGLGVGYIPIKPKSILDQIERKVALKVAEWVFIHDPAKEAVEKAGFVLKVAMLVKAVTLCAIS